MDAPKNVWQEHKPAPIQTDEAPSKVIILGSVLNLPSARPNPVTDSDAAKNVEGPRFNFAK